MKNGSQPFKILIVDDHALVREGTRAVLSGEPDLEVIGEAEDGQQALELCRSLRPDLVLMDVRMPQMNGLAATRSIKAEMPSIVVLMLTTYENPDYLSESIEAGAAGYVLKEAPKERLINAIRRALGGESPLNQELTMKLLRRLIKENRQKPEQQPSPQPQEQPQEQLSEPLTARELEVLELLVQGKTNPQIAGDLVVSIGTVKAHVQHIISKLGVSDRTQAAVRAVKLGIFRS